VDPDLIKLGIFRPGLRLKRVKNNECIQEEAS
jgi:hypothetical protein